MLKNYLKIALQNLLKHKSYTFINIAGLSIGIACSIFIMVFVFHELSYDKFNKKADQIHRVTLNGNAMGQKLNFPTTPAPLAATLIDEYPEVLNATRLFSMGKLVRYEEKKFNEDKFSYADSTFFDVFTMPLIKGDPKTVLARPNSVVLTEETAQRYFGNEDPMGKMLKIGSEDIAYYEVTGVMKNIPVNSHFHFNLLGSITTLDRSRSQHWLSNSFYTYIVLQKNFPPKQLEEKFPNFLLKYAGPQVEQILGTTFEEFKKAGNSYDYFLQPITDIHLHSDLDGEIEPGGNITYVYMFSLIALFILIIACVNFMNLSTARSANRAKEVGLRKVLGSHRSQLINQFLIESIFLSFVSLCLGLIIVEILFPYFNNLINIQLDINYFKNWFVIPSLISLVLFVGIIAGSYPAFFLASFNPVVVLKGKLKAGAKSGLFRNILVIFQFSISIIIFLSTFTVYNQLKYMQNKELGFEKEHVLIIEYPSALGNQMETFKQELLKHSDIINVCNTDMIPGRTSNRNAFFLEGVSTSKVYLLWQGWASYDYAKTLGLKMAEGRFFSPERADSSSVIINQAAVKNLGLTNPVVGKRLFEPGSTPEERTPLPIVGVVKDFNFRSLHNEVEPMVFRLLPKNYKGNYIPVKIRSENIDRTLRLIENKWESFASDSPFQYFFLDDDFNRLYKAEKRTSQISIVFSFLVIFIACLGLFGLVSFLCSERTKEIGVRKVMGSSVINIVLLLSRDFSKWILIANVIAWPVAYLFIDRWLENFSYRIDISLWMFIASGVTAYLIALMSVIPLTIMTASRNPVESLKYE